MKINSPVTQQEVFLQPGKPIVSKTDLKGIITYVNQSFIDISGFSREELIGKSHNIVRHPDMPPEAFAWLWDTIKQGLPWRGLVKNRCKNGDFYWVEAYVTPIQENDRVVGYMSVRNVPDRNEVRQSNQLYQDMRAGRASLPRRGFRLYDTSFYTRLNIMSAIMLLMLGGSSIYYLIEANSLLDYAAAIFTGIGALISISANLWLRYTLTQFLRKTSFAIRNVDQGNFSFSISSDNRDELGRAINDIESMRIHLRAIISDVSISSKHVDASSQHVAEDMRQLLDRSMQQSDRVNSISAATEEIHQSIERASELTQRASGMSDETSHIVRQGETHMNDSIQSVEKIVTVVNASLGAINELHDATLRIGQISQTIKDVAEQTNLLALNAAIEAARAGEQGRGFAVVADEVRKLAERTASSTQDITHTLDSIREVTDSALSTMNQAVSEVVRGTQLIQGSKANLDEILNASNKQQEMANEISLMLREQASATEDIATNMSSIFSLASENVSDIRKTSDTAAQLAATSNGLDELIRHFEKSL